MGCAACFVHLVEVISASRHGVQTHGAAMLPRMIQCVCFACASAQYAVQACTNRCTFTTAARTWLTLLRMLLPLGSSRIQAGAILGMNSLLMAHSLQDMPMSSGAAVNQALAVAFNGLSWAAWMAYTSRNTLSSDLLLTLHRTWKPLAAYSKPSRHLPHTRLHSGLRTPCMAYAKQNTWHCYAMVPLAYVKPRASLLTV